MLVILATWELDRRRITVLGKYFERPHLQHQSNELEAWLKFYSACFASAKP
jgi:hypothetical protein